MHYGIFKDIHANFEVKQTISWTSSRIGNQRRDFLGNFTLVYRGQDLILVHGTLDASQLFDYMIDVYSSRQSFQLLDSRICFIGHTHIPAVFMQGQDQHLHTIKTGCIKIKDDKKYIINVGSVGQPRDGDPRAGYCIYDAANNEIEFKRVDYDVDAARMKIIKAGLPRILGDRLLKGL